jgi:hypothetical protein
VTDDSFGAVPVDGAVKQQMTSAVGPCLPPGCPGTIEEQHDLLLVARPRSGEEPHLRRVHGREA